MRSRQERYPIMTRSVLHALNRQGAVYRLQQSDADELAAPSCTDGDRKLGNSRSVRRAIFSSVIVVILGSELRVATQPYSGSPRWLLDRPACARLLAVAPAGRSAASYTITRDTTYQCQPRALKQRPLPNVMTPKTALRW